MRPLLLVDVDGVLNCFGDLGRSSVSFEAEFVVKDRFRIRVPNGASAGLALLAAAFDCVWASTWMDDAHPEIGRRLGIPEPWPYISFTDEPSASATPKLAEVQRFIGTRPAAWIDDELLADAFRWAAARDAGGAPTLLLKTEVNVGMTPRHVDTLLAWARRVMSGSETTIDVLSTAPWPGGALSNFASHSFAVRGVHAASMEGFLQGLKCSDVERQVQIMQLTGLDAKRAGAGFNWRHRQVLYWQGEALDRHGDAYQQLLDEAYDALFVESIEARDALSATAAAFIDHSVGSNDPWETVLTIDEFCSRLVRIRKGLTGR